MTDDFDKGSSEVREGTVFLLIAVLVISAAVHVGLMLSLGDCAFAPLPYEVRSDRKWTKELPVMQMQKMSVDPLAEKIIDAGRPAAAPDTEKREDRVERLAGPAESAVTPDMPTAAAVAQPAADDAPPPAKVEAAEWRPRQEILSITSPVVPDDQSATPRLVIPKVERVAHASDVTPAFDLLSSESPLPVAVPVPAASLSLVAGAGGGPSVSGPLPPSAGVPGGMSGGNPFGSGTRPPSLTVLSQSEENQRKQAEAEEAAAREAGKTAEQLRAEKAAAEQAKAVRPPPPPAAALVDEKVVAQEKQAVRELRDEQVPVGKPFEENVHVGLGCWIDPLHPQSRYFRVLVSSRAEKPLPVVSKDIVFLLDASGSISNDRLKSCRKAVLEALRRLNTGDRFNVVAFRDKFSYAFPETAWKEVTKDSLKQAEEWMSHLTAHGQTDVFRTLRSVLTMPRDPSRPVVAFVTTDGDATSGMTRSSEIISKFSELNDGLISMFMYGVKESANAYLMDMLTRCNRGSWARHTGLRWLAASGVPAFSKKFESPVLSDISVLFTSSSRAEVYPKLVSNLCEGEPIEIFGVCPADQKDIVFRMRGLNGSRVFENMFRLSFASAENMTEALKTEWAQRRMYALIAAYTRNPSKKLKTALHRFAKDYGIQIPYEKEIR